jgi:hypothetical protein
MYDTYVIGMIIDNNMTLFLIFMMAEQTIIIHIKGYWRDKYKTDLLEHSGIFFVYEAKYNEGDQTVDLLKLLYIGEADNIKARILHHEGYSSWMDHLEPGHELCYACAGVDIYYRERIKAAYIITHKPPANKNSQDVFHFDTTTLVSTGKTALINPVVTARKNKPTTTDVVMINQRKEMIPVRAIHVFSRRSNDRQLAIGE